VVERRHLGLAPRVLGDPVERHPHLVGVGGPDDEVVRRLLRVHQRLGVRARHERHLVGRDAASEGLRVTGAPALDGDDALALQARVQPLRHRHVVLVVLGDQLDLRTVALLVVELDEALDAVGVGRADVRGRAREVEDPADLDRRLGATSASARLALVVAAAGGRPEGEEQRRPDRTQLSQHL
jgi:hypothetical protein